jgi:hypothetical protein
MPTYPVILSNTCIGASVFTNVISKEYNNPFIGTLIPNDLDFIKLCNNIQYYIKCYPILSMPRSDTLFAKQNLGKWYKHSAIKIPYPVILLDDIEIHCIHEEDNQICIDKFIRRFERMKETILSNSESKVIGILSFSELINNHSNIQEIIDIYLSNTDNIFAGPSKYKRIENNNYIIINTFNNVSLTRNSSHIYNFNDQTFLTTIFSNHISKYYK